MRTALSPGETFTVIVSTEPWEKILALDPEEAIHRELREYTGLEVRVLELIELFDRIYFENGAAAAQDRKKPRYHYVIADYFCELIGGEPRAGSDVTDLAFAREEDLGKFHLTEKATSIVKKAFAMSHERASRK